MLPQNISSWAKSFGTHSQSQSSSHYIPSGAWEMQSQTALVTSKSLTLSPIHIMTISVINSMTGCRLYNLSKPLLMRMSELKQVCIKEQVPSHEVKVTQKMNEHVPGVICHSVSPGRGSQLQAFPSVCCRWDNGLHIRPTYSSQF